MVTSVTLVAPMFLTGPLWLRKILLELRPSTLCRELPIWTPATFTPLHDCYPIGGTAREVLFGAADGPVFVASRAVTVERSLGRTTTI
jgi:hypothetical protein